MPLTEQEATELIERAWGIIANASEGDWDREHSTWKEAAIHWRDSYHAMLDSLDSPPSLMASWPPPDTGTIIDADLVECPGCDKCIREDNIGGYRVPDRVKFHLIGKRAQPPPLSESDAELVTHARNWEIAGPLIYDNKGPVGHLCGKLATRVEQLAGERDNEAIKAYEQVKELWVNTTVKLADANARIADLVAFLQMLENRGGLGYEIHDRIRALLGIKTL